MPLLHVNYYSSVLQMQMWMDVILPQKTSWKPEVSPPYQTLYLLHGLSDDHTIWQRHTSVERYAEKYNLAVVMPFTARGFYTDMAKGPKWWTHISEELPGICMDMFPLSPKREDTFAAGLSMGGYGALKLGLLRPDKFSAVAGLSGAYICADFLASPLMDAYSEGLQDEMKLVFGDEIKPGDDIFCGLERAAKSSPRAELFLCCGQSDQLFPLNAAFRDRARELGMEVKWSEKPNTGHTCDYWDEMLPEVLRWLPLRKAMKL